jgi:hypothetical protein
VSSTVIAGQDNIIQIVNGLSRGPQSFDGQFDSFRVYLSIAPPGWGSGPACYLANTSAITTTSLTVQIPASVGPSGPLDRHHGVQPGPEFRIRALGIRV